MVRDANMTSTCLKKKTKQTKKKKPQTLVLGNSCIFWAVTDSGGSSKCIRIKLDRSKHTYIQHSRGSIGKNAGLVPMLKKKVHPLLVYGGGGGGGCWYRFCSSLCVQ